MMPENLSKYYYLAPNGELHNRVSPGDPLWGLKGKKALIDDFESDPNGVLDNLVFYLEDILLVFENRSGVMDA